jgi:hypothetical protein
MVQQSKVFFILLVLTNTRVKWSKLHVRATGTPVKFSLLGCSAV